MRVSWVAPGSVQSGFGRGVLYLADGSGVPWDGLINAVEKADDVIQSDLYLDGIRFAFAQSTEDFALTLDTWSYPVEFEVYDGHVDDIQTKQPRRPFGLTYKVDRGDDYELHLVWNAMAAPSEKPQSSRTNETEPSIFQWELVTRPKSVAGIKPTAHFVVDSEFAPEEALQALEDLLYGTDLTDPTLPEPQEVIDLFRDYAVLIITDNGDGTWTATGPDEAVQMLDSKTFQIAWPSAIYTGANTYTVSSM